VTALVVRYKVVKDTYCRCHIIIYKICIVPNAEEDVNTSITSRQAVALPIVNNAGNEYLFVHGQGIIIPSRGDTLRVVCGAESDFVIL